MTYSYVVNGRVIAYGDSPYIYDDDPYFFDTDDPDMLQRFGKFFLQILDSFSLGSHGQDAVINCISVAVIGFVAWHVASRSFAYARNVPWITNAIWKSFAALDRVSFRTPRLPHPPNVSLGPARTFNLPHAPLAPQPPVVEVPGEWPAEEDSTTRLLLDAPAKANAAGMLLDLPIGMWRGARFAAVKAGSAATTLWKAIPGNRPKPEWRYPADIAHDRLTKEEHYELMQLHDELR